MADKEPLISDEQLVDELALIALGEREGDEGHIASLRAAILYRLGHDVPEVRDALRLVYRGGDDG